MGEISFVNPKSEIPLTNTHIHTNYSFSVFESPAQAVGQAVDEGISILGINDHYTIEGHNEFSNACAKHNICPMFSMEAVALDIKSKEDGTRLNDPNNPGRCYLTAKSISRKLDPHGSGAKSLHRMRSSLTERNIELIKNLNNHLRKIGESYVLSMEEVEALTHTANTTERHVIQVLAENTLALGMDRASKVFGRLCGESPPDLDTAASLQSFLRSRLIKAGCPDYAPEFPEAFLSIEDMVDLYLEMGAVPLYPVLGNPVTELEKNIRCLVSWIEERRIFALEVIPNRNTRERLMEIVDAAREACIPVVTGTEHNTKTPGPLVDKFSNEEPFRTAFYEGALVLLGHRAAIEKGGVGYVDSKGKLRYSNREEGMRHFMDIGLEYYRKHTG